jgi:bifunctional enzyme CysN/CysC
MEAVRFDDYLAEHQRKDLLRFLTCGSVDDGKSTLIGRLLLDTRMVYEDQLAALKRDSQRHGTAGAGINDPALLLDGLEAEREQGITIDVAYRYFSTKRRKFIIADTPGHEQYTRNMATGASTCNLAVILIDARRGVLPQTRRHSTIVSLLGIRHVVVAVNKMDLVGWSEEVFARISDEYAAFAAKLQIPDVRSIPISALQGDNVVFGSENTPWYSGGPLLGHLENVHVASDVNLTELRLPVQVVLRPNQSFRGFAGTLAGGVISRGDPVLVLPGERSSRVRSIVAAGVEREQASAPMAVTVTLEDEIDASRGAMLVSPSSLPHRDRSFEAMVVWMDAAPMRPGAGYLLKQTTSAVAAEISEIFWRTNVETLAPEAADRLEMNEIGRVELTTARPIFHDPYAKNRATGSFILIDRVTNATVGAGMILEQKISEQAKSERGELIAKMTRQHAILKQVAPGDRAARLGHRPAVVWLTGLPRSGKSTVAYALEKRLHDLGALATVLDGVEMRLGLNRDLGFSPDDRSENGRRSAEVAKILADAGMIAVCAFVAPFAADREAARQTIGPERFFEVYLSAPVAVCKDRDDVGLYAPSRHGELKRFVSISDAYEPPVKPDLVLPPALSPEEGAEVLVALLRARGVIA